MIPSFLKFLDASPSVFHAGQEISSALTKAAFTELHEGMKWNLAPGKGYFVCRGSSLIVAFRTPKKKPVAATILATHIDSPCLKIKPHPEEANHSIGQFGVEVYGAPILHSWLDRDLVLAGKICVLDMKGKPASHLVLLEDTPLIIPQLALHLDRTANEKGIIVNKQDHLKPIFSLAADKMDLEKLLKKRYPFKELLGFDLFLSPLEKSSLLGANLELLSSARLDNLSSAFAALVAMTQSSSSSDHLQMAFFWDHEEIGSMSAVGADSRFADEILERITSHFELSREEYFQLKSRSFCLSGDLAHGFHPSYAEKYDLKNAPFLGRGPTLKFNANQKYATTGAGAAFITHLAKMKKIPLQHSASRSDIPSGSTVGSIMASQLGILTADVGIAGWAMHSIRETIASNDLCSLISLFQAALSGRIDPF